MSKPIAILSSNYHATVTWVRNTYDINHFHAGTKSFYASDGNEYMIVMRPSDAYGYEFSAVIAAPDYVDLRKIVEDRIR